MRRRGAGSVTMRRQVYIDAITDRLAFIDSKLRMCNGANLTDLNIHLEPTFGKILNLLKGWDLVGQNILRSNAPGIDLADWDRGIGVQLTSRVNTQKVKKTFRVFFDQKLDEKIKELYIVFISNEELKPSFYRTCASYAGNDFAFEPREQIWNLQSLTRLISAAELDVLEQIKTILDDATGYFLYGPETDRKQKQAGKSKDDEQKENLSFLQLPLPVLEFIPNSRVADIAKIHQAMLCNEPIYVTGPSGIGKTELVLKMAWNNPGAKKAYYMKFTSNPRAGESLMQTTILEANMCGGPYTNDDPAKRRAECNQRIRHMFDRLRGAIMILDGFDPPGNGKNLNTLKHDPDFQSLNTMGAHLIITTRSHVPYCACKVEALDAEQLNQHVHNCCEQVHENDDCIPKLIDLFQCNTLMIHLLICAINHAKMLPEQILEMLLSTGETMYTPHLFLQKMRMMHDHAETTPEQRADILAFFDAIESILHIGEPLQDWYRHAIAEGGL